MAGQIAAVINKSFGIFANVDYGINGISADLNIGEKYNFNAEDNGTFRLGDRMTTRVSGLSKIYTRLAYQVQI